MAAAPDPSRPEPSPCGICGGSGHPYREKYGYAILRCTRCGNAFVPESVVPQNLEEMYSKAYFEGEQATGYPGYLRDRELLERNFQARLEWIRRLRPPGNRLLDVGAAYGLFLKVARADGFEASGVEIAPDCALEAAAISGVSVACGDFLEVPLTGPYDVITMLDVIEHFRDPVACVRRARELLSPGGLLVVETGDIDTLYPKISKNRWHFLDPPQHLFYFSLEGMKQIFREAGLVPEPSVIRTGRRVSTANIAFKLAAGAPAGPIRTALAAASRHSPGWVYLNFGDGMFVGGRRP